MPRRSAKLRVNVLERDETECIHKLMDFIYRVKIINVLKNSNKKNSNIFYWRYKRICFKHKINGRRHQ